MVVGKSSSNPVSSTSDKKTRRLFIDTLHYSFHRSLPQYSVVLVRFFLGKVSLTQGMVVEVIDSDSSRMVAIQKRWSVFIQILP